MHTHRSQESVNVAVLSLSTMPSTAPRVLSQPSGTMSLGILQVTSSLKCALMSALNQFCRRWEVRPSTICLQIKRIMQDRTSEQEDSGDLRINAHFLTLRCSILTRRRIDGHPLNPAINARRRRRSGPMNRESWMWNMERSLHLCSAPLAEWEGLPGHFMPVLPTSYPSNDRPDMQQQWD